MDAENAVQPKDLFRIIDLTDADPGLSRTADGLFWFVPEGLAVSAPPFEGGELALPLNRYDSGTSPDLGKFLVACADAPGEKFKGPGLLLMAHRGMEVRVDTSVANLLLLVRYADAAAGDRFGVLCQDNTRVKWDTVP